MLPTNQRQAQELVYRGSPSLAVITIALTKFHTSGAENWCAVTKRGFDRSISYSKKARVLATEGSIAMSSDPDKRAMLPMTSRVTRGDVASHFVRK